MASAGTVTIDFAAETAKFTAELKKVQGQLASLESRFTAAGDIASKAISRLATVFSVGALTAFTRSAFAAADATADAAARAGIAADTFSRLQFAARQTDVEMSALTVGIRNFQIELSKADDGTKSAAATLSLFGLSAKDLAGLKLEEQLAKLADGFTKIQDPADRTRAAMELFGRSGLQLVPFLAQGAEGIRRLTEEADRLGITMSISTARGIGVTDEAMKKLIDTVKSWPRDLIGEIANIAFPPATELGRVQLQFDQLTRSARETAKAIENVRELNRPGIAPTARVLLELQEKNLETRLRELQGQINALRQTLDQTERDTQELESKRTVKEEVQLIEPGVAFTRIEPDVAAETTAEFEAVTTAIRKRAAEERARIAEQEAQAELDMRVRIDQVDQQMFDIAMQRVEENALLVENDVQQFIDGEERKAEAAAQYADQVIEVAKREAEIKKTLQQGVVNNVVDLLRGLAPASKKAAIAAIAIEKASALARAIQAGAVAMAQAAASAPPPYNAPAILWTKLFIGTQIAAILASGYGQIRQVQEGPGPGAPLGTPTNPAVVTPSATQGPVGATSQRVVNVTIANNVGWNRRVIDELLTGIKQAVEDDDVVIFSNKSRQAQDLMGVSSG